MKLLWVASGKLGSKLIRWGLDEDCSHFAVCFDESSTDDMRLGKCSGMVFHSHGKGTQIAWLRTFLTQYTVIHALDPLAPLGLASEEDVYQAVLDSEDDKPYDYPALGWFAWRALLKKTAGVKFPRTNNWQQANARLCVGIIPALAKAMNFKLPDGIDTEMTTPHEMFHILRETGRFFANTGWAGAANGF